MSDRVTDYHAYVGELEARIEALEAALREITEASGIGGPAMQTIALAALAPEQKDRS